MEGNTMLIKELFPNVNSQTIKTTFDKYNVEIPENFTFSPINIVIGSNGSGKTRFLHAIKELYSLDNSKDILYGYFPALSGKKISIDKQNCGLPECTLYDSMYMDDVSFSDFFKEIETHNEDFIPELLEYHSQRQKERGEKALDIVTKSFLSLTGKKIIIENKKIYIKDYSKKYEPLSVALSMLSPGELTLFYMSIFLAIQQNGKKNKAIILDEPESHLHPKALISFVEMLTQTDEFAEIWIATHSLFIIPEYQFENIIYIYESKVQKRTSIIYQNILNSLLGDEKGKVQAFFSSLSQWQYCEFIAECFADPTVIDTVNPKDEQVQLFIEYLYKYKPIRILDCGGGSGRLGLSLEAAQIDQIKDIIYDIYDKHPTYKGNKFSVYTNLKEVQEPYHCVVMMNFLHEVNPSEWKKLFNQLYDLMETDSYLLFVEVKALAQGEMPTERGFFILSREELEILFQCPQGLSEIRNKENQKSSCIVIPRSCLLNVNEQTIQTAIIHLQERILNEIIQFRKNDNGSNVNMGGINSRRYAFLSQQFINAKLFIDSGWELSAKQLKKTMSTGKKADKLVQTFNYIDKLWHGRISKDIYISFQDAANSYLTQGFAPQDLLTKCWGNTVILEKKHVEKKLIALFLAALALMGEVRGVNRLTNNRYIEYLPEELSLYLKKLYKYCR